MKSLIALFTLVLSSVSFAQGFNPCRTFFWSGSINPTIERYEVSFLTGIIPASFTELAGIQGNYIKEKWSKQASNCLFNTEGSGLFSHSSYVFAPTLGKVLVILESLDKTGIPNANTNFQVRLDQAKQTIKANARNSIGGFENLYAASELTCQELNTQSADIDNLINFYEERDIFATLAEEFCSEGNRQKLANVKADCETKLDAACNLEDLYAQVQDCANLVEADPRHLLEQLQGFQQLIKAAATGCTSYRSKLRSALDNLKVQL